LIYDWMGGLGKTSRRYWKWLRRNGVDVRCYNPPKLTDPLGIFSRDHRKCIVVDGETAFVSGLCVGRDWVGDASRNLPPWRDTGAEIRGPAVAEVEEAFAVVWATAGSPLEIVYGSTTNGNQPSGKTDVRIIKSEPSMGSVYRVDNILSSLASDSIWLTDAYFVGVPAYMQSLKDAVRDGVDVRLLLPQTSDIGLIRDTTRSTYRPLLEAGVRVYEWNGSMMHAKTAVFDGKFSRVGSTNLNIASWFGNYELDILIDEVDFGKQMQEMFLEDIENATEIVLEDTAQRKFRRKPGTPRIKRGAGSMRKATAGALNAATSIGSAIANKSRLGPAEARLLAITGSGLLAIALLFVFFPRIASIPLIVLLLLLAIPTLVKAIQSYRNN
jgi:cardiolipin synthase